MEICQLSIFDDAQAAKIKRQELSIPEPSVNKRTLSKASGSKERYFEAVSKNDLEFSGSNLTFIRALGHSMFGNGEAMTFPIHRTGIDVELGEMDFFKKIVAGAAEGETKLDVKFTYDTRKAGTSTWLTLGNVTLRTEGSLLKNADGSWTYNGVVRAFDDRYDPNPSTHRTVMGERLTDVLRVLLKTEYDIKIPGELKVQAKSK
jgi:hypothetical protein